MYFLSRTGISLLLLLTATGVLGSPASWVDNYYVPNIQKPYNQQHYSKVVRYCQSFINSDYKAFSSTLGKNQLLSPPDNEKKMATFAYDCYQAWNHSESIHRPILEKIDLCKKLSGIYLGIKGACEHYAHCPLYNNQCAVDQRSFSL